LRVTPQSTAVRSVPPCGHRPGAGRGPPAVFRAGDPGSDVFLGLDPTGRGILPEAWSWISGCWSKVLTRA
jgi:hypothetical protein